MSGAVRVVALSTIAFACAIGAAACGGGGNASKDNEGAAAVATGTYFLQEANGGRLPEGTSILAVGSKNIVPLSVTGDQKKQSVSLRYCVEYSYTERQPPSKTHSRVYVTSKMKNGQWSVESVKDDGTCDGVA